MIIKNTNDGSQNSPYLRLDMNYGSCNDLPAFSDGPKGNAREKHLAIKNAGFLGVQDGKITLCRDLGLELTAHARLNEVGDLDGLLPQWKNDEYNCITLHVGWGLEDDIAMDRLVDYVLNCSIKFDIPIYFETHRATITQDMQRTVALIKRFPEIRFNGDFSHWYTGQEMVYGGIENKWEFLEPVFDRVRFIHGRIGNPGSIQVTIGEEQNEIYVDHFKEMWIRSFHGFLKSAAPGDFICFTIELLAPDIFYARTFKDSRGVDQEEGDRWQQALIYKDIALDCWEEAKRRM